MRKMFFRSQYPWVVWTLNFKKCRNPVRGRAGTESRDSDLGGEYDKIALKIGWNKRRDILLKKLIHCLSLGDDASKSAEQCTIWDVFRWRNWRKTMGIKQNFSVKLVFFNLRPRESGSDSEMIYVLECVSLKFADVVSTKVPRAPRNICVGPGLPSPYQQLTSPASWVSLIDPASV